MFTKKGLLFVLFTIVISLVFTGSNVDAENYLKGIYVGDEIVISNLDIVKHLPSVAYNWKHNEYLVVWHTDLERTNHGHIRGARISDTGQVLSEFVVYQHDTKDSAQPSVEYDPVNDRYLVVWAFDYFGNGDDWDLYGRLIPWNGPSSSLNSFAICNFTTHQKNPKLAYGRAMEEFLIVWNNVKQDGTSPTYISGRRIKAVDGSFPGLSNDFTTPSTSEQRVNADVTYNLARNEYLIVYDNTDNILGTRLTGDLSADFGGEFSIASFADGETKPAVAACKNANQYLVVWQSDQVTSVNIDAIYGRTIEGNGSLNAINKISYEIGSHLKNFDADVACNEAGTQYLSTWTSLFDVVDYQIEGRLVQPDKPLEMGFHITEGTSEVINNPITAGGRNNYLVAWEHQRDLFQDIHGRLIIPPHELFLPLIQRNSP